MLAKWMSLDDAICTVLPRENHHRHTSTRVGAAAGEVEVFILLANLGRLETEILFSNRFRHRKLTPDWSDTCVRYPMG